MDVPMDLDFDPDNEEDLRRYHNNAIYHAQVYLAAHIITRQPRGYAVDISWQVRNGGEEWIL